MVEPIRIPPIGPRAIPIEGTTPVAQQPPKLREDRQSFRDVLASAITEVQRLQDEADSTIKQLVAGEIKDVTEAMVAVEKADVAFQTMMTVRGKVMTAYEEIMRMQI